MSKKKMVFVTSLILIVVVISLGIVKLYQTYALGNYIDASSGATHSIFIYDDTSIKVPANSSSNVFYMVNNTSPGTVRYGVGYTTDTNISVKIFNTSIDPASGLVDENGKKYVKLRLENSSSTTKRIELSTVLGYSGDDDLIVPTGVTLVTEVFSTKGNFATYIKNLYEDATKTTVINNSITYNYATSESLMNDRLGDSTTDINGGNIRYYGASPNNYVYFNCNSYPKTNCERWRVIGVFDGKVKLMRNEEIGTYPWDNKNTSTGAEADEGSNNWNIARIMKLLNSSDYYTIDTNDNGNGQSLYYNAQSGNCFSGIDNDTASCNFTSTGLKTTTTRNMISTVTYPLGGADSSYIYADQMYKNERNPENVYGSNSSNWVGKVAFPYASDYGYAVDFNQCDKKLSSYNDSTCANNNWMSTVMDSDSWLLTHNYDFSSIILYVSGGVIMDDDGCAYSDFDVLPSLYLNSKVELVDGTGTYNDPYQLSDSLVLDNEVISNYTVTYNANGGSGAPSTQTKLQNETLVLSSTTPTRTGYQFMGWNTSADGSGTSYQASANYYDNSSVTLYAQWKKNITVTYNANGGSGAPNAQTKLSGESLTLSSTIPTMTGYTFTGWNTSSSGNGTSYTSGGTYSADDSVTLYAQWSINYYDLTLSKGTGVSTIYYKVNEASSYSSTTNSSIKLSVKYGTTYYYYGVASTGYVMSSCTSSRPCTGIMGTSSVTETLTATTNSYNLTITKGTGVSTIYYKVNGASTWTSSSSSNVTLTLNYNTSYSYYGVASTGYTMNSCTSSKPCTGTMGTSSVTETLTATINSYNLTIVKGTGVDTIYYKVNGASTWTSSSSSNVTLILNYNTSYSYYGVASGEYTMNSCTSSDPCTKTMGASAKTVTLSAKDSVPPNISADLYSGGSLVSTTTSGNTIEYSGWLKNQATIVFTASDGGSGVNTSITEYYGKSNSSYPSASSLSSSSNTISSNNTYTKNITVDGYIHTGIRVCDNSSNCSTFYVKFKLDSTPPSATLSAYYTNGGGSVSFTSSGNTFRNDTWLNKVITLELTPSDNVSGVSSSTTFNWNRESIPSTITDSSVIKTISSSETLSLSSGKFTRGISSPGQRYVTYNLCDNAGNCVTKEVYFKLDIDVPTLTYEGSSSSDSNTKLFACSSLSGTEEFRSSDSAGGTTKRTSPNSGNYYTHWWSSNSNQLYVTCESNAKNQSRYELVRSSSSGTCTYTNQSMDLVTNRTICITNTDTTCDGSQKTYTDCTYNYSTGKIDYKHWYWKSGSSSVTFNKLGTCIGCVD